MDVRLWFTTSQNSQVLLYATECWVCGIPFAWPDHLDDRARERGTTFYCPNGHKIHYGESENERLRRQLEVAEAGRKMVRQLQNLRKHMQNQHPDYVNPAGEDES